MLANFNWKNATFEDLHLRLGSVPLHRIGMDPVPGMATVDDVIRHLDASDKRLYELVDGTLVEKAMGFQESIIGVYISTRIRVHVELDQLGIVAGADGPFLLTAGRIRFPDVSFVPWSAIPDDACIEKLSSLPPVLAIEVLSESNTRAEIDRKLEDYFAAACRLAWVIDPKTETARVYTSAAKFEVFNADTSLDGGTVLPGFLLSLKAVFAAGSLQKPTLKG